MSHPTGSTSEYTRQELLRYHGFRLATYLDRIEEVEGQPYSPWEELLNALEWPYRCLRQDWDNGNMLDITQDLYKLNFALGTFREATIMYLKTRDAESDSDALENLCNQAMDALAALIYETRFHQLLCLKHWEKHPNLLGREPEPLAQEVRMFLQERLPQGKAKKPVHFTSHNGEAPMSTWTRPPDLQSSALISVAHYSTLGIEIQGGGLSPRCRLGPVAQLPGDAGRDEEHAGKQPGYTPFRYR